LLRDGFALYGRTWWQLSAIVLAGVLPIWLSGTAFGAWTSPDAGAPSAGRHVSIVKIAANVVTGAVVALALAAAFALLADVLAGSRASLGRAVVAGARRWLPSCVALVAGAAAGSVAVMLLAAVAAFAGAAIGSVLPARDGGRHATEIALLVAAGPVTDVASAVAATAVGLALHDVAVAASGPFAALGAGLRATFAGRDRQAAAILVLIAMLALPGIVAPTVLVLNVLLGIAGRVPGGAQALPGTLLAVAAPIVSIACQVVAAGVMLALLAVFAQAYRTQRRAGATTAPSR
jgi:hypothetical protein